jgi:hypothetical protein
MTDPREHLAKLEERFEVLEPEQLAQIGKHEHLVPQWVWVNSPDGSKQWQVGACTVCGEDVTHNGTGASFSAWVAMP